jgi:hypothetical protein
MILLLHNRHETNIDWPSTNASSDMSSSLNGSGGGGGGRCATGFVDGKLVIGDAATIDSFFKPLFANEVCDRFLLVAEDFFVVCGDDKSAGAPALTGNGSGHEKLAIGNPDFDG